MAPECLRGNSYNLKADVYSFSIILWEILTARTPYAFVRSRHQLMNYVLEEEGRPEINKSWPSSIQGMLESSFYSKSDLRPVSSMLVFCLSWNFNIHFSQISSSSLLENVILVRHHSWDNGILARWREVPFEWYLDQKKTLVWQYEKPYERL